MAATRDLKFRGQKCPCRFEPDLRYKRRSRLKVRTPLFQGGNDGALPSYATKELGYGVAVAPNILAVVAQIRILVSQQSRSDASS